MINLSLDASTTCTGWAIFDDDVLINFGKIKPTILKLEWRDRIINMIPQLHEIMKEYKPKKVYCEDVPLMEKRGKLTLVQLGAVQGSIIGVASSHNIETEFINVGTWRKDIGLYDGTESGKERNNLKAHSIELANKLFDLNLDCIYTKGGNYNSDKSDDDISDCILMYSSTREKYKVHKEKKKRLERK